MKTLLTAAALFFAGAAFSQNSLDFTNRTTAGVVGDVTVLFTDHTSDQVFVGGPGNYHFDIGSKEVEALLFGSTLAAVGETVAIKLSDSTLATQRLTQSVQDEGKGFSSLIR